MQLFIVAWRYAVELIDNLLLLSSLVLCHRIDNGVME